MGKKYKESIEGKTVALLEEAGATIDGIITNKHVKVKWTLRGQKRMVTLPSTASDYRAEQNCLSQVKRDIREIENEAST